MIHETYWETPEVENPTPTDSVVREIPLHSLFVPYGDASDFYYSGHTGLMVILTLEFWRRKCYFVSICSFFTTLFMMQVLMIYKIHWSIGTLFF